MHSFGTNSDYSYFDSEKKTSILKRTRLYVFRFYLLNTFPKIASPPISIKLKTFSKERKVYSGQTVFRSPWYEGQNEWNTILFMTRTEKVPADHEYCPLRVFLFQNRPQKNATFKMRNETAMSCFHDNIKKFLLFLLFFFGFIKVMFHHRKKYIQKKKKKETICIIYSKYNHTSITMRTNLIRIDFVCNTKIIEIRFRRRI